MRQAVRAIVVKDDKLLVMSRNKFGHKYYALIGGGIDPGETAEFALRREVKEEASLRLGRVQLVFVEETGQPYGTQYVFWCEYVGGEPVLQPDSDEAKIHNMGKNLYQPVWLPLNQLASAPFMSSELKQELVEAFTKGFPTKPKVFSSEAKHEEIID